MVKGKIEEEYRDVEAEKQARFRTGSSTVYYLYTVLQVGEIKRCRKPRGPSNIHKSKKGIPLSKLWKTLNRTS